MRNEALLGLIQKKLEGTPVAAKKAAQKPTNVLDLMSRLKASLEKSGEEEASSSEEQAPLSKPARKQSITGTAAAKSASTRAPAAKKPAAAKTGTAKAAPKKAPARKKESPKTKGTQSDADLKLVA